MAYSKFNVNTSKSGIEKRTYNEITFDSELEMKYYRDVVCPQLESGYITKCEMQIDYELQPKFIYDNKTVLPIKYKADFVITFNDGRIEVIDTKGCPDNVSKIKRKMFWYVYPDIIYLWITYSKIDGGWVDYEIVKKGRSIRKREKSNKLK